MLLKVAHDRLSKNLKIKKLTDSVDILIDAEVHLRFINIATVCSVITRSLHFEEYNLSRQGCLILDELAHKNKYNDMRVGGNIVEKTPSHKCILRGYINLSHILPTYAA